MTKTTHILPHHHKHKGPNHKAAPHKGVPHNENHKHHHNDKGHQHHHDNAHPHHGKDAPHDGHQKHIILPYPKHKGPNHKVAPHKGAPHDEHHNHQHHHDSAHPHHGKGTRHDGHQNHHHNNKAHHAKKLDGIKHKIQNIIHKDIFKAIETMKNVDAQHAMIKLLEVEIRDTIKHMQDAGLEKIDLTALKIIHTIAIDIEDFAHKHHVHNDYYDRCVDVLGQDILHLDIKGNVH